jgi:hypothetical protein
VTVTESGCTWTPWRLNSASLFRGSEFLKFESTSALINVMIMFVNSLSRQQIISVIAFHQHLISMVSQTPLTTVCAQRCDWLHHVTDLVSAELPNSRTKQLGQLATYVTRIAETC